MFASVATAFVSQWSNGEMGNVTPESEQLRAVKRLIEALDRDERAMLRPWLLAKFDVQGYPQSRGGE